MKIPRHSQSQAFEKAVMAFASFRNPERYPV